MSHAGKGMAVRSKRPGKTRAGRKPHHAPEEEEKHEVTDVVTHDPTDWVKLHKLQDHSLTLSEKALETCFAAVDEGNQNLKRDCDVLKKKAAGFAKKKKGDENPIDVLEKK